MSLALALSFSPPSSRCHSTSLRPHVPISLHQPCEVLRLGREWERSIVQSTIESLRALTRQGLHRGIGPVMYQ